MNHGKRGLSAVCLSGPIAGSLLAFLLCAPFADAQDGYWVNSQGGRWSAASNWDPANGIAGGADNTAYFGFAREASIAPDASFTIDGAQSIGNLCFTSQGGAANWTFRSTSGGSLALQNSFGLPEVTVTSPSLQVTINAALAGTAGVAKDGPGALVLGGANTYTGRTFVSGGLLSVTGSIAAGGLEVTNAALSGSGVIGGPVTVDSGGTLFLGNSGGPLTVDSSLVLLSGSTTVATISAGLGGRALVQGLSSVTYGGTLVLTNASGSFSLGQAFSIFGSPPASGNFAQILPPPGPGLGWRFNPATGEVSVVSAAQPAFSDISFSEGKLSFALTGGPPGGSFYLLSSSDLTLPKAAWNAIATNVFDMNGSFTAANALSVDGADHLYLTALIIPPP
jgi:autotransporter-associated beta strand protein